VGDAGVDVSGYNNVLDWGAVRGAGTGWAWSKATEATGYTNGRFTQQISGARAAGLAAGAYHFADPRYAAADQVAHFVAVAKPYGAFAAGAMLPMLDVENEPGVFTWTAAQANAFIPAFRDALRQATGQRKLCVYASQNWWLTGFLRPGDWADQDIYLCAARYGVTAGNVGWTHPRLAAHQYTDASQPYALDRSVTVGGFSLGQLTIGDQGDEDDMGHGFWFIGKTDGNGTLTGDVALLYPNGDLVGVWGSNWSAVVAANGVPKLDVPPEVWDDMRTRFSGYAPGMAAAFKSALAGLVDVTVTVQDAGGANRSGKLVPDPANNLHFTWVPDDAPASA
jgi:lysozyme